MRKPAITSGQQDLGVVAGKIAPVECHALLAMNIIHGQANDDDFIDSIIQQIDRLLTANPPEDVPEGDETNAKNPRVKADPKRA